MSDDMSVADVLDAAADYIRTHGGLKHSIGDDGGPRCASGALHSVVGDPTRRLAMTSFHRVMGVHVVAFNDYHTTDEVIDALMEAAARLREQEQP